MSTADKLVAAGGIVVGLSGGLGVAYYIYSLESVQPFWSWPGTASVIATGIGLLLLVLGLLKRETRVEGLEQSGGDRSTNYQAGRDMTIGRNGDADQ